MQARFLGLDGRPTVLSIRRSRVDWGARKRAFGTIILCQEPVTVAACRNRDTTRQPDTKKNPGGPPERPSILSIPPLGSFLGHSGRFFSHFGTLGAF